MQPSGDDALCFQHFLAVKQAAWQALKVFFLQPSNLRSGRVTFEGMGRLHRFKKVFFSAGTTATPMNASPSDLSGSENSNQMKASTGRCGRSMLAGSRLLCSGLGIVAEPARGYEARLKLKSDHPDAVL